MEGYESPSGDGGTITVIPGVADGAQGEELGVRPSNRHYESVSISDPGAVPARGRVPKSPEDLAPTVHDVTRDLRRDLAEVSFPLDLDSADAAKDSCTRLLSQLDEHLLPRLLELSSPAVVVIAGSTGAGKSTLYNSLLGDEVSEAGVLRPTTREPVFAYNPLDEDVLVHGPTTAMSRVVEHSAVPRGVALLDAPDLDSLLARNRETAKLLLEAADLWLFVTTAARYGDALPWETLAGAMDRGASVAMVLNRVPRQNLVTIRADLLARLRERGMDGVPLFVIPDVGPHEGLLDQREVAPIGRWLTMLAGPDRSRAIVVRTLKGSLGALPAWVEGICESIEAQIKAARDLRSAIGGVLPEAEDAVREGVRTGRAAHGALSARWAQIQSEVPLEKVRVRGGVARSTKRRALARQAALEPLAGEARAAAERILIAAGVAGEDAVLSVVERADLPGMSAIRPDREAQAEARPPAAAAEATAWIAAATSAAATLAAGDRAGAGAARAFGNEGLTVLLLVAAAGEEGAERLVAAILGDIGTGVAQELRADLGERAAAMVRSEAEPALARLAVPALAADADTGLRVRLAELRRLL